MNWRDHPLLIPLAAAGTTSLIFIGIVIPIWTMTLEAQIQELASKNKLLTIGSETVTNKFNTTIDFINSENERINKEKSILAADYNAINARFMNIQIDDMFDGTSPYPKGFGEIRIGDRRSQIDSIYPDLKRDDRRSWSTVHIDHQSQLFEDITYYFDAEGVIDRIKLYLKDTADTSSLKVDDARISKLSPSARRLLLKFSELYEGAQYVVANSHDKASIIISAPKGFSITIDSNSYIIDKRP